MADKCNCGNNCKCGFEINQVSENNFEYSVIDGEGNTFLTGDGFETYDEALTWLADLGHYIGRGIDKLSHSTGK